MPMPSSDLIAHILDPLGPETVFPIHYDDLFGPLSKTISPLIGVDLDEFRETRGNQGRAYRVKTLPIGKAVVVFQ